MKKKKKDLIDLRPPILLCNISFNIILPSTTRPCEWSPSFWLPHQTTCSSVCHAHHILWYEHQRIAYEYYIYGSSVCDLPSVATQQVTPEHAPDFNYNRSFSSKRPAADEAVCRNRGRHVECYGLIVLRIVKGASYWDGNWNFLIARYTVLYKLLFLWPLHIHSILQPSDPP